MANADYLSCLWKGFQYHWSRSIESQSPAALLKEEHCLSLLSQEASGFPVPGSYKSLYPSPCLVSLSWALHTFLSPPHTLLTDLTPNGAVHSHSQAFCDLSGALPAPSRQGLHRLKLSYPSLLPLGTPLSTLFYN